MENSFGEFLRSKRNEKNITQKELANNLYVSESAVSKWEKNVARPDISLLPELAKILNVTEHELITASIDNENRTKLRQAKKWRTLTKIFDLFWIISYGIAVLTCFIVNLAVEGALTWFWIVFSSLLLASSLTTFPRFIKKRKLLLLPLISFAALTLLLVVCSIYTNDFSWFWFAELPIILSMTVVFMPIIISKCNTPKFLKKHNAIISITADFAILIIMLFFFDAILSGNRFFPIALPITLLCCSIAFLNAAVICYLPWGKLLKSGTAVFLWGVWYTIFGYSLNVILEDYDGTVFAPFKANFLVWEGEYINNNCHLIGIITCIAVSVGLIISGVIRQKKTKRK